MFFLNFLNRRFTNWRVQYNPCTVRQKHRMNPYENLKCTPSPFVFLKLHITRNLYNNKIPFINQSKFRPSCITIALNQKDQGLQSFIQTLKPLILLRAMSNLDIVLFSNLDLNYHYWEIINNS